MTLNQMAEALDMSTMTVRRWLDNLKETLKSEPAMDGATLERLKASLAIQQREPGLSRSEALRRVLRTEDGEEPSKRAEGAEGQNPAEPAFPAPPAGVPRANPRPKAEDGDPYGAAALTMLLQDLKDTVNNTGRELGGRLDATLAERVSPYMQAAPGAGRGPQEEPGPVRQSGAGVRPGQRGGAAGAEDSGTGAEGGQGFAGGPDQASRGGHPRGDRRALEGAGGPAPG